ncbi:STAS domain-containing protein [Nocardia sp. N13]|jgi:anti-sigma B factor antagonist|uniref:STAS domain-containing protein n=1 Tax=Nocardioides sp. N13(2025) TaxID=3453405 RepID=UPI003F7661F7
MSDWQTEVSDGVAVIVCPARVSMAVAASFRDAIGAAVAQAPRVVVDLGPTTFIDSSGLGALVSGLKTCRQAGGDLRIAAAGEQVRTVLKLTNLDRILRAHPTVEDARSDW